MLIQTFIHIPGISYKKERRLWREGYLCWEDILGEKEIGWLNKNVYYSLKSYLLESRENLSSQNHIYFKNLLPKREVFRVYPEFSNKIAYIDVETNGNYSDDCLALIGLNDGDSYKSYIRGVNLDEFAKDLKNYSLLVTFNGSGFDIPVLKMSFPTVEFNQLHIDLYTLFRRLGFKGGLKSIENQLGLQRDEEVAHLTGYDAVWLWRQYLYGSVEALNLLIMYNKEDVNNLKFLLDFAYEQLRNQYLGEVKDPALKDGAF